MFYKINPINNDGVTKTDLNMDMNTFYELE